MNHENRFGRFTSSEIYKLMSIGKREMTEDELAKQKSENPKSKKRLIEDVSVMGESALTYIKEKQMEIRLGRSLNTEIGSRETWWGKLVEQRVFDLLGTEYSLSSTETDVHPTIEFWSGSKDGLKHGEEFSVFDIKSPFTLKSFCTLADCKTIQEVREKHDSGENYFWQLVSNAILTGANFAELIFYVPYQDELADIRDLASNYQGDQNKVAWVQFATDFDLPYLIKGGHYNNLNTIRFEVSEEDKRLLTQRVIAAGKLLQEVKELVV